MTAAVITLSLLAASLGAALVGAIVKLLSSLKDTYNARRAQDALQMQNDGLVTSLLAEREQRAKHVAEIAALNAALTIAQARAVHGMSVDELVGAINGGMHQDGPRRDPGAGADPGDEDAAVPAPARTGPAGAHGDELSA